MSGGTHVSSHILGEVFSVGLCHDLLVESSGLLVVAVGVSIGESSSLALDLKFGSLVLRVRGGTSSSIGLVVNSGPSVSINSRLSISRVNILLRSVRVVDGHLIEVSTESMSVSIGIREESSLEHLIIGSFNSWNEVSGGEGSLLNLSEPVLRVSVENELTDLVERVVSMGPDLGNIEDIESVVLSLFDGHDLDVKSPGSSLSALDVLVEISLGVVGCSSQETIDVLLSVVLDSGISLVVILDPELFAISVNPFVSMRRVAVHVSKAIRSSSVREENSELVEGLGMLAPEVPGGIIVGSTSLGVVLLGMDEVRELDGVSDEENGGVVTNEVVDTLLSVMLDRESSGVSDNIRSASLTSNSGESGKDRSLLANLVEIISSGVLGNILRHLEISMSAGTLGMHDSLRDSLRVKLGELVDKMSVLEESGASDSGGLRVLVLVNGGSP